tara:strand:- start:3145 stop:3978 length:834 start_codon:yes stop_codon:yes gene_type:complete
MSSYLLPEGNVQISFSGGRTSGFMLHKILEANGDLPERCKVLFTNTGLEMPETLDFVQECSERWNVPITWLEYIRDEKGPSYRVVTRETASENGQPFEQLLRFKKYMPSPMKRFCTTELKMFTIKRFIRRGCGWDRWTQAVGIRYDEPRRIRSTSKDKWDYWYPLAYNNITKEDVSEFWNKQKLAFDFDLQLPNYKGKTPSGNCDFCFLKSESTIAYMLREYPERAKWWINIEKEINFPFRLDRDLTKMQDFLTRQGDWIFDDEAYLCQSDDGECTG